MCAKKKQPNTVPILSKPSEETSKEIQSLTKKSRIIEDLKCYKLQFIILFITSLLVYSNTITHDYTLDDQLAIFENKFVTQGISGIPKIMTTDAFVGFFGDRGSRLISGGRYRPLSFVSFAIEWELLGKNPGYKTYLLILSHTVNILLYGILCCAIFYFLQLLIPKNDENSNKYTFISSIPFIAALIYCVHPMHTEVVANIKGRDEIMCFLFCILALIYYLQYFDSKKLPSYLILFCLFFCGLLSKENAITFVLIFPLSAYYKNLNKDKKQSYSNAFILILLTTGLFLILRHKYTAVTIADSTTEILNNPFARANTTEKYSTILYSFYKYFQLLLFPNSLTHDYYFNQIPYKSLKDFTVWGGFLIMISGIYFGIKKLKEKSFIGFAILFFIITFSLVSNIIFTVGIIMNERFVFISSLGFCILFALAIQKSTTRWGQNAFYGILLTTILLYSFKTYSRNFDWKDNYTLFAADYKTSTNSAKVATSYGGCLNTLAIATKDSIRKNQLLDSSIKALEHSLTIYPENVQTWSLLASSKFARHGNLREAITNYTNCINMQPGGFFDAYYSLGSLYYNSSQYDSALFNFMKAYEMQPDHKEARSGYASCLAKKGRTDEAISLGLIDSKSGNLSQLALAAKEGGNYPEALKLSNEALIVNPKDPVANYVKGICIARFENKIAEGIPYLEVAVKLNPQNTSWMEDLAVAYGFMGRISETIPLLEKAIAINPDQAALYPNLITSYTKIGNLTKANYYKSIYEQKIKK